MRRKDRSITYVTMATSDLKVFFEVNGFKNDKALELEGYHRPAKRRKKPEYIPIPDEIERMVAAGCLMGLAGFLYGSELLGL